VFELAYTATKKQSKRLLTEKTAFVLLTLKVLGHAMNNFLNVCKIKSLLSVHAPLVV
jgi:hypothetical protein